VVTGLNTNVERGGCVYHVQTEQILRGDAVVESLVFRKGEILVRVTVPCAEGGDPSGNGDLATRRLLERQHRSLVRKVRHGMLEGPRAPAADPSRNGGISPGLLAAEASYTEPGFAAILSDLDTAIRQALNPVVRDAVTSSEPPAVPGAGPSVLVPGRARLPLSVVVRWRPRPRTRVVIRLPW